MPPLPFTPRVVVYHQTHHTRDGQHAVSLLPLLGRNPTDASARPAVTHLVVAAIHLNGPDSAAGPITLNDHPPDHPRFSVLWEEVAALQARGVRVLGLLGGAAQGSYARLDVALVGDGPAFETAYAPLAALVRARRLDGLDLDVEEPMSLRGIVHLVDRLRRDFGPRFLLTFAPVAAALLRPHDPRCNLSGFSYRDLERARGHEIAWYHAQFYCGWGDASQPHMYAALVLGRGGGGGGDGNGNNEGGGGGDGEGWPAHRVVMGLVTNPANGAGFVPLDTVASVVLQLQAAAAATPGARGGGWGLGFGGVAGWEYFNSLPGGEEKPWEWAEWMSAILGAQAATDPAGRLHDAPVPSATTTTAATAAVTIDTTETTTRTTTTAGTLTMTALRTQEETTVTTATEAEFDIDAGSDAPVPSAFVYASETEE
ncbi:aminotransferase class 3 [Niveomyces insectorum RCEF 264]|uniref:Aminotransferase class 3 n=1 Tax=Niveomyces insectorum RCEF 264 TaxID=1081102 RepID=A0A167XAB4_9HYPO|nr:aminotransferase class 3 [Niveomyces insectorum RCEF 264]